MSDSDQEHLLIQNQNRNIFSLAVPDKKVLASHYLPFVRNGGLYIPTDYQFHLDEQIFLLLNFVDSKEKISVCASVVLLFPAQSSVGIKAGVGIRFEDRESRVKSKIELCLSELEGNIGLPLAMMG